jgi:hypothetical protein
MIPLCYLLGFITFRLNNITPEAEFPSRTFLLVYCCICVLTFAASMESMRRNQLRNQANRPATARSSSNCALPGAELRQSKALDGAHSG